MGAGPVQSETGSLFLGSTQLHATHTHIAENLEQSRMAGAGGTRACSSRKMAICQQCSAFCTFLTAAAAPLAIILAVPMSVVHVLVAQETRKWAGKTLWMLKVRYIDWASKHDTYTCSSPGEQCPVRTPLGFWSEGRLRPACLLVSAKLGCLTRSCVSSIPCMVGGSLRQSLPGSLP